MIDFKKITLEDKLWMDDLLARSDFRGAEYNFTNFFIWQEVFKSRIARFKDFILFTSDLGGITRYLFPAGSGDVKEAIDLLESDARDKGVPFILIGLSGESKERLDEIYPDSFDYTAIRDSFDYIYERESLITLSGKRLQSKRNHMNHFINNVKNWSFEEITEENIQEVRDFTIKWCIENGCKESQSKSWEICAVNMALTNFFKLNIYGGIIRVDGKLVAYSVGERLNSDTLIVHIEKADASVRGIYQIINREFISRFGEGLKYVNREDDAGDQGLRKAKESYHPVFMQEKYAATKK